MELLCSLVIIMAFFSSPVSADDNSDVLMPLIDSSSDSAPVKDNSKVISAVKPKNKISVRSGKLEFAWQVDSTFKGKKFLVIVENLDTDEKSSHPTTDKKLTINLVPGKYRWHVISLNAKAESHWRTINVSELPLKAATVSVDSDPQVQELAERVKASQIEAKRALKVAREQQAKLASLEADRKAKRLADQKFLALKEKDYQFSRRKVAKAQAKFKSVLADAKKARSELEVAIKDAKVKGENFIEPTAPVTPTTEESPPQQVLEAAPPARIPTSLPPKARAPVSQAQKPDSDDLKWSDEK
jgi:hypothetical protein